MSTVTFNNRHFDTAQDCAICLTATTDGVADEHGHLFHENCIRTWTNHSSTCPTCRRQVTAINGVAIRRIRQVYMPNLRDVLDLGSIPRLPAGGGRGGVAHPDRRNVPLSKRIVVLILVVTLLPYGLFIAYLAAVAAAVASVFIGLRNALGPRTAN